MGKRKILGKPKSTKCNGNLLLPTQAHFQGHILKMKNIRSAYLAMIPRMHARHSVSIMEISLRTLNLNIRKRLGELTKWDIPLSAESFSVGTAIEKVLEKFTHLLCFDGGHECESEEWNRSYFMWSMNVRVSCQALLKDNFQKIYFIAKRKDNGKWEVDSRPIEAALSLGTYYYKRKIEKLTKLRESMVNEIEWRPPSNMLQTPKLHRILGPDKKALRNDLKWWISAELASAVLSSELPDEQIDDRSLLKECSQDIRQS
jgi:hypothetical protein